MPRDAVVNEGVVLALPAGVQTANFDITAERLGELAAEVERLLDECDHDEYTATISGLKAVRLPWKPGDPAVWDPWSCVITLKRRR